MPVSGSDKKDPDCVLMFDGDHTFITQRLHNYNVPLFNGTDVIVLSPLGAPQVTLNYGNGRVDTNLISVFNSDLKSIKKGFPDLEFVFNSTYRHRLRCDGIPPLA